MYNVGVFPGKFLPPHRGHLNAISQAITLVNHLYVVVSDNVDIANRACEEAGLPYMPLELRAQWMLTELQNINHVEVIILDEAGIPPYPHGYILWAERLIEAVPKKFDVIFGSEEKYRATYAKSLPAVYYKAYDRKHNKYPISATEIREHYLDNWDYILDSAKKFLALNL